MVFTHELPGPLLERPAVFAGESLRGYFLRLSEDNGLSPQLNLYQEFFGGTAHWAATQLGLIRAEQATGICLDALSGHGYSDHDGRRACRFAGHRVAQSHVRTSQCAVCPLCLDGCKAIRGSWDLAAVAACSAHGCWLVDQCPRCRLAFSWKRPGVAKCLCGYDMSRVPTTPAPPAACALTGILEHRLTDELPMRAGRDLGFPAELELMPVGQLLAMFHMLGNVHLSRAVDSIPEIPHASGRLRCRANVVSALADALIDWPRGWRVLQERVIDGQLAQGVKDNYLVTRDEAAAPFMVIGRSVQTVSAQYPPMFRGELRSFLRARAVKVGSHCLFVAGSRRRRTPDAQWMLKRLISGSRHDLATCQISRSARETMLNATSHQLRLLQQVGLPACIEEQWVPAVDLDEAFDQLASSAHPRSVLDRREFISLADLNRCTGELLAHFVEDILQGRATCSTWAYKTPAGLRNLFVPADMVRKRWGAAAVAGNRG